MFLIVLQVDGTVAVLNDSYNERPRSPISSLSTTSGSSNSKQVTKSKRPRPQPHCVQMEAMKDECTQDINMIDLELKEVREWLQQHTPHKAFG